jgi:hypothetical protein
VDREGNKVVRFTVRNDSDLPIELRATGKLGPREQSLPAHTSVRMRISGQDLEKPIELSYTATNFLIAPEKGLPVSLRIPR